MSHSQILRAIPVLIIACIFTFPGHAQYSGGRGTADDPYQIATAADLIGLQDYDKHFILMADIDLDPNLPGRKVFDKAVIARFTGALDGNGHTISHLTIKGGGYLGLFGELRTGAEVRDLGITDVNITASDDYAGGLVGSNEGTVTGCRSAGVVSGREDVGGLVGGNWGGTVTNCYSTGVVRGNNSVGGLLGENQVAVTECSSSAEVNGDAYVGGLVGSNEGTVTQCCSTGVVSGGASCVGGLVGINGYMFGPSANVTDCYSTNSVKSSGYPGGLVGGGVSTVTRCYSTGTVRGSCAGGLIAGPPSRLGVIACFWDTQTSGQGTTPGGTGKTTAEMQMAKTFLDAGWDFVGETKNGKADIWWIFEGQDYPRLAWERVLFDDFEDGKAGPLWMSYELEPERVRLAEVHGRLEVEAVAQDQDVDAIYAADGWRLDASKPFALRVDFHFAKRGPGNGRVTLGLIPRLDPAGMQWAEFEAGCFDIGPIYLYEVRDGAWVEEQVTGRSADGGTLFVSYNPGTDELYFSYAGYGKPNAWRTVPGLLKGRWAGGPVYVILAGGSEGMALTSGDAWLDNFTISTGVIVR